ncbi:MAG TPA: hypothetical protein VLG11_03985 [Candidatus Saccharimonadales bacterium]|nr:hypothetical protein [Candidatus Saccharimonadales bacterium]
MSNTKPTIVICSSASFYRQAVEVDAELQKLGFDVVLPKSARAMKASGDYSLTHQTWHTNPDDYPKKSELMRTHFDEIARGDAILILNYEKHGQPNYIGGNVLMEMAMALFMHRPIFLLNPAPEDSSFLEEILGTLPIVLDGDIGALPDAYEAALAARGQAELSDLPDAA